MQMLRARMIEMLIFFRGLCRTISNHIIGEEVINSFQKSLKVFMNSICLFAILRSNFHKFSRIFMQMKSVNGIYHDMFGIAYEACIIKSPFTGALKII